MTVMLIIILLLILFLPFTVKMIERNLEIFLAIMGIMAALASGVLNHHLIFKAVTDPLTITFAVFFSSILFKWMKNRIETGVLKVYQYMSARTFLSLLIIVIGLVSSLITAILAAIVLVSIISILKLDRKTEVRAVILACFSIGIGSILTPVGEPLATITTEKLHADFSYLFLLLGYESIIGVIVIGIFALFFLNPKKSMNTGRERQSEETYGDIIARTIGIYLFVMGLTLLGASYETLANIYLIDLDTSILYWVNMTSAILDNATLAAAEMSPEMNTETIRSILFSLVISGGMLVPGNIPNIISANKLGITMKEWAKYGLPIGLFLMIFCFIFVL